jgi:hypothetical protein
MFFGNDSLDFDDILGRDGSREASAHDTERKAADDEQRWIALRRSPDVMRQLDGATIPQSCAEACDARGKHRITKEFASRDLQKACDLFDVIGRAAPASVQTLFPSAFQPLCHAA